jgi:hypothetical protein
MTDINISRRPLRSTSAQVSTNRPKIIVPKKAKSFDITKQDKLYDLHSRLSEALAELSLLSDWEDTQKLSPDAQYASELADRADVSIRLKQQIAIKARDLAELTQHFLSTSLSTLTSISGLRNHTANILVDKYANISAPAPERSRSSFSDLSSEGWSDDEDSEYKPIDRSISLNKYLKYKKKYLDLKNKN